MNLLRPKSCLWVFALVTASTVRGDFDLTYTGYPVSYSLATKLTAWDATASVIENGPVSWTGGSLRVAISTGYDAASDHLAIRSNGNGPGLLGTERDPMQTNALIIHYSGIPFARAIGFLPGRDVTVGSDLVCAFNSNTTAAAIQALMRNTLYVSDMIGLDSFTNDLTVRFPPRTVEVTLADGGGSFVTRERDVEFPYVVDIRCIPPLLSLSTNRAGLLITEAVFNDGHSSQRLGTQVVYTAGSTGYVLQRDPVVPEMIHVIMTAVTAAEATRTVAQVGGFRSTCCVHIYAGGVSQGNDPTCPKPVWAMVCPPDPGASAIAQAKSSALEDEGPFSLATFHALQALMRQSPEGVRLANMFKRHGREILQISFDSRTLVQEAQSLLASWQPAVSTFLGAKGTNAMITQGMINSLNRVWNQFTNSASPTLRSNLITERSRFSGFQDFAGKNFNQWAQMLQLPVPTNAIIYVSKFSHATNAQFTAQANYISGLKYSMRRTDNFSNWTTVTSLSLATNGLTLRLTDTNAPVTNTFYQAIAQP